MRKILLFLRLARSQKVLFVSAWFLAIYAWVMFLFFKKYARFSDTSNRIPQEASVLNTAQIVRSKEIRWAILAASKYIFLTNACRHQALQAKILCNRYAIPYTIFVGFKKNEAGQIEGHAWTQVGETQISGMCDPQLYHIQQIHTNTKNKESVSNSNSIVNAVIS